MFFQKTYIFYILHDEKFTRMTNTKNSQTQVPTTLISLEIPSKNGRHYPLPQKWQNLHNLT